MLKRRWAITVFWGGLATVAVTLALLLTAARLLFPHVDEYRQDIEVWAGEVLGQTVSIGELDARWRYTYPEVILRHVTLLDHQSLPVSTLPEISLSLDMAQLLLKQQISFVHLNITLDKLTLQRDPQGQISVPELHNPEPNKQDEGGTANHLLQWLLKQGSLSVNVAELIWVDQHTAFDYRVHDVQFSLTNDGDHHQLSGAVQLPSTEGASLELAVDLVGNPLLGSDWHGQAYLSGDAILLPHWLSEQTIQGQQVTGGRLDFSLWSEWANGSLSSMQSILSLQELELKAAGGESRDFEYIETLLDWQRIEGGWQVALNDLALSYQQHRWPQSNHVVRIVPGDERSIALQSDYLHLADIDNFIRYLDLLPAEQQAMLAALQPQGELANIVAHYSESGQYSVSSDLNKISLSAWDKLPSFNDVSGHLALNPDQGMLQLNIENGSFEWPKMFRQPIPLEQLHGEFSWRVQEEGWSLDSRGFSLSNQHLSLEGAINLLMPTGKSPFLDLALEFKRADMAHTSRYLPLTLLPKPVLSWLDQGIATGEVVGGGMIYHGAIADFPYRHGEGQFEVAFEAVGATIVPGKGWLPISNINASVAFQQAAMSIKATQGEVLNSHIQQSHIAISDMGGESSSLSISGDILAETPDILEYLLKSPVAGSVDFLSMFKAKGEGQVALTLEIPLAKKGVFTFNAHGSLQNVALDILPADLSFEALSGELHISTAGLAIKKINGLLYGEPITVSAETAHDVPGGATQLQIESHLSGDMLSQYFNLPLFSQLMSGKAPLSGHIFIPHNPEAAQRVASVKLDSTLLGLALALPGTLEKPAQQLRPLTVELQLLNNAPPQMQLTYDQQLAAWVSFEEPRLRGEVLIGEQRALQLPQQPGLVINGELSAFSLSQLLALLPTPEPLGDGEPGIVRSVKLKLGELELFDQQLQSVDLTATQLAWQWFIDIDSPQAKGRIALSEQLLQNPIVAEMEYLHLNKLSKAEPQQSQEPFDMWKLPPLQIQVKSFSYDTLPLGAMRLKSRWLEGGYQLEELLLHPDSAELRLEGTWHAEPLPLGVSSLKLRLESSDISRTISGLGFAGTIKNGEGYVNATIDWLGGLSEFEVAEIDGKIDFKLENGRILDVEPGAGRIMGLFSIQMLPRRLLLDFGDLFGKGFRFNEIRGHYDVVDGLAKTDNFTLLGSSVRMDMLGSVDLAKKEYDQRLIVTPFVTDSLPLLTYLTGVATPQIAALLFLAQKVFQDDLAKIAQFEYRVSGPWDNPEVVKVEEVDVGE
ncbi:MAG: TIGR02099 family protein [Gammaproteobacteria bacterium]|nr:TIGR02099 family protein [Gammaproteobacteria bacterium]MCF6230812.1 TIGR02099 family protein [Gammaproteobacteria bacterium]